MRKPRCPRCQGELVPHCEGAPRRCAWGVCAPCRITMDLVRGWIAGEAADERQARLEGRKRPPEGG